VRENGPGKNRPPSLASHRCRRTPGAATFVRYAAVGLVSLVVDAGTLWLLYDVAHQQLWLATSAGVLAELRGELRGQQVRDLLG
jgi:hypothetical protein